MITGVPIDLNELAEDLLVNAEMQFIFSKKEYPTNTTGDSFEIVKKIHFKYRL